MKRAALLIVNKRPFIVNAENAGRGLRFRVFAESQAISHGADCSLVLILCRRDERRQPGSHTVLGEERAHALQIVSFSFQRIDPGSAVNVHIDESWKERLTCEIDDG